VAQHIHIVGICGTFMGGIALLAREQGHRVSGSDANVYPPMSTQLADAGIALMEGYSADNLQPAPDLVIVGNALSRGNPEIEAVLNRGLSYISGPQWLGEQFLAGRWVLAVAGTHGKTTTTSILAWILECADMAPGFLVGGVPGNFGLSARAGQSDFFVVEADEYDTAFFDKRSKFVHYRPRTLIVGNLEFDHADIFSDLSAIETQFHHLLRCVPGQGLVLRGPGDAIDRVLARGVWSEVQQFGVDPGAHWSVSDMATDGRAFTINGPGNQQVAVQWQMLGRHNMVNALGAIAAAHHVGVPLAVAAKALGTFRGVKRRLEWRGTVAGIAVYDDFAHHPTAIAAVLATLRDATPQGRVIAAIEPRSATMRTGVHGQALATAAAAADFAFWLASGDASGGLEALVDDSGQPLRIFTDVASLTEAIVATAAPDDVVVLMSNGGFGGIHEKLLHALRQREDS
jgi:UDP-N-acetylmuramate: L-alanyl-gamma-D-glutamyl-meso-diaminopimelate ligase